MAGHPSSERSNSETSAQHGPQNPHGPDRSQLSRAGGPGLCCARACVELGRRKQAAPPSCGAATHDVCCASATAGRAGSSTGCSAPGAVHRYTGCRARPRTADGLWLSAALCAGPPCQCTEDYEPVCGSDFQTYGSACVMACANVVLRYPGVCSCPQDATQLSALLTSPLSPLSPHSAATELLSASADHSLSSMCDTAAASIYNPVCSNGFTWKTPCDAAYQVCPSTLLTSCCATQASADTQST